MCRPRAGYQGPGRLVDDGVRPVHAASVVPVESRSSARSGWAVPAVNRTSCRNGTRCVGGGSRRSLDSWHPGARRRTRHRAAEPADSATASSATTPAGTRRPASRRGRRAPRSVGGRPETGTGGAVTRALAEGPASWMGRSSRKCSGSGVASRTDRARPRGTRASASGHRISAWSCGRGTRRGSPETMPTIGQQRAVAPRLLRPGGPRSTKGATRRSCC